MIVGLEGIIVEKEPTRVEIDVNGIIYEVFVSINCSDRLNTKDKLKIKHIITEKSQTLYGFLDKDEKSMFETLIKVNGVGPKVALAICSTFTPNTFMKIVSTNDVNMLKKVPGIGPKSAKKILAELSDFSIDTINQNNYIIEATLALETLGFKNETIQKALKECTATNTSDLVKEALKIINKI